MSLQGSVHVLPHISELACLHTKIRDKHADVRAFTYFSVQMIRSSMSRHQLVMCISEKCYQKVSAASSVGLDSLMTVHSSVQLITEFIEETMNDEAFMGFGMAGFGDRYIGTYPVQSYE